MTRNYLGRPSHNYAIHPNKLERHSLDGVL